MRIDMNAREAAVLEAFLRSSNHYLEFGSGGSTALAATCVRRSIISVEASPEWIEKVKVEVTRSKTVERLTLHNPDIGPTRELSYPLGEAHKQQWSNYSTTVWSEPDSALTDLCLVDGRFRVACFCETMARCAAGVIILIHDFDREAYQVVLEVGRRLAVIDRLSVFTKDQNTNILRAMELSHQYRLEQI
jgi:hypothetical protein